MSVVTHYFSPKVVDGHITQRRFNIMSDVKERPRLAYFNCPHSDGMVIAPVFGIYHQTRYEAWAKFWFEKGKTGRGLCLIICEGGEYAPSTAAKIITGNKSLEINGWTEFWQYEGKTGVITLDDLANTL
jgi:hypothetical protein